MTANTSASPVSPHETTGENGNAERFESAGFVNCGAPWYTLSSRGLGWWR